MRPPHAVAMLHLVACSEDGSLLLNRGMSIKVNGTATLQHYLCDLGHLTNLKLVMLHMHAV